MGGLSPAQFQALGPAPAAAAGAPQGGGLTPDQFSKLGSTTPPVRENFSDQASYNAAHQAWRVAGSQAQGSALPENVPTPKQGTAAYFLPSLGTGVKETAKAVVQPAAQEVHQIKTETPAAFKGGLAQIKKGAADINNTKGNPLDLVRGFGRMGSGIVSAAFSPLAAPLSPVNQVVNVAADKLSNIKAVQKFSGTTFGKNVAGAAENVSNYSNIAQAVGGFVEGPKVAAKTEGALNTVAEAAKPGMEAVKNDIAAGANKVAETAGKVRNAVQDHYVKQVANTWAKPAEAVKGFSKAQDIFNTAADKGHNIAQTLAESKINPSDNITKGVYTTAETAEQMHADANKMSNDMIRPSLQRADLTTPKTPVADVIALAKENIKNNPKLTQEMKDSLTNKLGETSDALSKQHPDGMSLTNMHDEKIVRDQNAKYSPVGDIATNAEAVKNKAVADAARKLVEDKAPKDVPVHAFNAELTKMHQAATYLDALNGKKAPTGAFSKLANYGGKLAGLAVGHGVGGGILADVAGYHIGGMVERMFEGMSNPLREHFLTNLEATNPEAFAKVSDYLKSPGPTPEEITAANTPANPNNLKSAGGAGGTGETSLPKGMGPYDIAANRNTTMGTKLPPGTRLFSQFEKMFTPDQIKQAEDLLQKMQNQGKTIDMKAVNDIVKRVTPIQDIKPIAKPMQLAQDAARINRISKIPVKGAFSPKPK